MAIGFSFLFLLLLLILGGGLALPVARLFHAGIACAREDTHRVTPENPWVFFRRGARGTLRRILFALLVLLALGVLLVWPQHARHWSWLQILHVGFLPLALGLSVLTTSVFVAFLIAPRVDELVSLGAVLLIGTLLLLIAGFAGAIFLLPEPLGYATYSHSEAGSGGQMMQVHAVIPTYPFTYLAISAALLWAAWSWAKRQGERWFRFEG